MQNQWDWDFLINRDFGKTIFTKLPQFGHDTKLGTGMRYDLHLFGLQDNECVFSTQILQQKGW